MAFGQTKAVREAKRLAEDPAKPDFAKAESLINDALVNPETKDDANTWNVAAIVQRRISEKENEKAYLKKPYDTLKVYNSVYKMIEYFLKADEIEQIPNEKGKVKFKFRKGNAATLIQERPNLINGGIHYFNQDKNKEAFKFFALYVDVVDAPMLEEENLLQTDTLLYQVAYYATLASMKEEDYKNAVKYAPYAAKDKEVGKYGQEFLAGAYKALGDTIQWVDALKDGIKNFPDYSYFFGHLIDYYSNAGKYEEAMVFADDMIAQNANNPFFLYVKGYLYQNMKDYENAIVFYKKTIEADPTYAEAYSNLGLIYVQQGLDYSDSLTTDFNDPKYNEEQAKIKSFYEEARPYYEKARALKPEQKDLWMTGLYTIYYRLGMGPEFEEIEKLMQ